MIEMFNNINKSDVQIVKQLDVSEVEWCEEAVLIRIKNGKGTLSHIVSKEDEEYSFFSQLLLNDKPIIQGKYSICPTCKGMLANGYGIENIHSEEFENVRECMNSEYKGIINSVDNIKLLLGLLNDGYYVLADVKLFPSDGQGNFFYSVPNELTYNEAVCDMFYDSKFSCSVDGFPAYMYPTQSSKLIHEERVEEYIKIMKENTNPPRGLAFYEKGFVCALLDGHHKACAASALGKTLNCLTIIPPDKFYFGNGIIRYEDEDSLLDKVGFAGIIVDVENGEKLKDYRPYISIRKKDIQLSINNLTCRQLPNHYINSFPTIETMVGVINAKIDIKADAIEYAKSLISSHDEECAIKLDYLMKYLSGYHKEEAYNVAKMILAEEDEYLLKAAQKSAIKELMNHRNEETEQYFINYLANHNSEDPNWDLVGSYWK